MALIRRVLDVRRGYRAFEVVTVIATVVLVVVGNVGLLLAIAGHARPVPVFGLSAVISAVALAVWRPDRPARPDLAPRVPTVVVIGALLVIAGSGLTNALYHAQYVKTDRDPGIYTAGGLWIANNGNLVVDGRGPGLDGVPGIETTALGQQTLSGDDSRLEIQGTHLFPVLLASGDWVGGDTGFEAMPAVIGMVALAAFFLLALWYVPPWLALAAQAALAVNFVFVYGVRSTLSEPTTLLFAAAGTWMLLAGLRARSPWRMLVAGAVVASTLAARIDGGVAVLALPATAAIAASRRGRRDALDSAGSEPAAPRSGRPWVLTSAFVAGLMPVVLLARLDLHRRSAFYLHFHSTQVGQVEKGLLAGLVLAAGVLAVAVLHERGTFDSIAAQLVRHRRTTAKVVVVAIVVCFAGLWFIRPLLGPVRGGLPDGGGRGTMEAIQVAEGSEPDGARTYAEVSVDRLSWYVGPVAIALGVAGMCVLARRVLDGDDSDDGIVLLALALPTTLLYLWKPSIFPDNPWMLRRYLPVVIPGLLVFAAVAVASAASWPAERYREGARRWAGLAAAVVGSLLLVAGPLRITVPLRAARWQAGGMAGMHQLCDTVGPDSVVVFSYAGQSGITLLPSFRAICGVPAARASTAQYEAQDPLPIDALQSAATRAGRQLWVVANSKPDLLVMAPGAIDPKQITIFDTTEVTHTLSHPPRGFTPTRMVVWVAKVPVGK
ncbi:MAG: hypothetical protein KDB02_12770 [Acidimicrobiales bacterium]|nr:hypothetical protein [Acidimicrobiales bacterium]